MADEITDEVAAKKKATPAPDAPVAAKPYGQNPGDVVDHAEAVGGRYEAVGAGKFRRLPD